MVGEVAVREQPTNNNRCHVHSGCQSHGIRGSHHGVGLCVCVCVCEREWEISILASTTYGVNKSISHQYHINITSITSINHINQPHPPNHTTPTTTIKGGATANTSINTLPCHCPFDHTQRCTRCTHPPPIAPNVWCPQTLLPGSIPVKTLCQIQRFFSCPLASCWWWIHRWTWRHWCSHVRFRCWRWDGNGWTHEWPPSNPPLRCGTFFVNFVPSNNPVATVCFHLLNSTIPTPSLIFPFPTLPFVSPNLLIWLARRCCRWLLAATHWLPFWPTERRVLVLFRRRFTKKKGGIFWIKTEKKTIYFQPKATEPWINRVWVRKRLEKKNNTAHTPTPTYVQFSVFVGQLLFHF